MTLIVSVSATVAVPTVPNFVRLNDGQTLSIADVTDDGLRALAAEWTENLIARAAEIRAQRPRSPGT